VLKRLTDRGAAGRLGVLTLGPKDRTMTYVEAYPLQEGALLGVIITWACPYLPAIDILNFRPIC